MTQNTAVSQVALSLHTHGRERLPTDQDLPTVNAFSSAAQMLRALEDEQISATELLDAHLRRVERLDGVLNSIVVRDFDRARRDARLADDRRAAGDRSPLLGLPLTIKESIDVEGLASTAGVTQRGGHRAARDACTVARLRSAGAVVFGKTNVCTWLADYQADNPVYGRTNSPWNLKVTPGGSSGGSATLAAGLTPLDLGSDLGGSIRVPAAFCGLWGHKPSGGIVPNTGHFPGSDFPNPALPMPAQGPHARSARDLELVLSVIAGAEAGNDVGWKLSLPPARHERLRDFRVAALAPLSWMPVDADITSALNAAAEKLRRVGASVTEISAPIAGDLRNYYGVFRMLMSVNVSIGWDAAKRQRVVEDKLSRNEEFHTADARGIGASAAELIMWMEQREKYRAAWREFFKDHDVLLAPITLTAAFEHTRVPNADRRLRIGARDVEFEYMSFFPSLATLSGLPATVFPAGMNAAGLPLGLQIIGPSLEDRTTLGFAKLMEQEFSGFQPPPGYDANLE